MTKFDANRYAVVVFMRVLSKPKRALILGGMFVVLSALGMIGLVKDTSVDAFIPDDHPSVAARDRAQEIFGLRDPVVVAVVGKQAGDAYSPDALSILRDIQGRLQTIENVRNDRIMSILTESSIRGTEDELLVDLIGEAGPIDDDYADRVKSLVQLMPPYIGTLVSEDGTSSVVVAELKNQSVADETYQDLLNLVAEVDAKGFDIHVAGQGAVGGYLSKYIDKDSRKMQPVVVGVILVVLFLAFLRVKALAGPLLVIGAAALGSIGIMAWFGVPYFAITSALPVVILSIAVADSIHVLTAYYELRARKPKLNYRRATLEAMLDMWLPVTLTTLTTAAGFIGLAKASIMPPIMYFGLFAALGVMIAWAFTMFVLPPAILLMKLERSPMFQGKSKHKAGKVGALLAQIAVYSARYPLSALVVTISLALAVTYGATHLKVDRAQVDNFKVDEPIRIADGIVNEKFSGTSYLDVIVDTGAEEGLLDAERMQRVMELQRYLETLPHVQKTVSIADYISLLHKAVMVGEEDVAALPEDGDAIAQYLLLYESSADPTDFEEEITQEYQSLLIRAYLNSNYFSEERGVVEQLMHYLETEFNGDGMNGTLSGRVNIDYHWMKSLGEGHFTSVGISLVLVWLVSSILFRSVIVGFVALLPVLLTILGLYALMAVRGIYLEPATSMFAAISIGVGIDFAIHLIDRIKLGLNEGLGTVGEVVVAKFPHAARACFFNASALGAGFCVLLISELPTLQRFGALVAFACIVSFLSALVIVPMAWALMERFSRVNSEKVSLKEAG